MDICRCYNIVASHKHNDPILNYGATQKKTCRNHGFQQCSKEKGRALTIWETTKANVTKGPGHLMRQQSSE